MKDSTVGWAFVAAQAVFLAALVFLPARKDWSTPGWVDGLGFALFIAGVGIGIVGSLGLGRALTPTPVPNDSGLKTGGLYRWVRHPIYSAVLLLVVGLTVRSGSYVKLVIAVATVVFFYAKSTWEEQRLSQHYPDYADYRARTGRFVPRFGLGGR